MNGESNLTISDRVVAATRKLAEYRAELSGSSALGASGQVAFLSELIQLLNPEISAINAVEHALTVERKRWNALKKELEHRYATEGIPARKAEVDSILAEMYALEMGAGKDPSIKCDCDGGCFSREGCYQQSSDKAVTQ